MTVVSLAMPNSAHTSVAAFITVQSESLPIKMPTNDLLDLFIFIHREFNQAEVESHHFKMNMN